MESSSVIILDSDSNDGEAADGSSLKTIRKTKTTLEAVSKNSNAVVNENGKRTITAVSGPSEPPAVVRKRIKPITIASSVNNNSTVGIHGNFAAINYSEDWENDIKQYQKELAAQSSSSTLAPATPSSSRSSTTNDEIESNGQMVQGSAEKRCEANISKEEAQEPKQKNGEHVQSKNPVGKEFSKLMDACRKADPSKEMETLIEKKLLKYYRVVHPDYINSKSFIKAVVQVTADILTHPALVYLKLSSIVEELNVRRKSGIMPELQAPAISEDKTSTAKEAPSAGTSKKDRQIAKLNRTLYCLKKRIKQLEEADVDFNQDINSTYLMAERYKKRAFEVYEKLCDITGESKNAHRLVRKPIRFEGTPYSEFNRTLQIFVNKTNSFPNFRDVLRCLQHCNAKLGYGLRTEHMNQIAQTAFDKIGRQLQKRRKTDLYETVIYYAGEEKDPALIDLKLREKLEGNKKHYKKVNQLIEKFAQAEHITAEEENQTNMNSDESKVCSDDIASQNAQSKPSSSLSEIKASDATATSSGGVSATGGETSSPKSNGDFVEDSETDEDDDDDDDDEEEEDEDGFDATTKENVRPDNFEDIVISDDEELLVPES